MKLYDLSYPIEPGIPLYPDDPAPSLIWDKTFGQDEYNSLVLKTGMHAGTHIDAPFHLLPQGKTIDAFPLEAFAGRGVLLDARSGLQTEQLQKVQKGDILLVHTGKNIYDKDYFAHTDIISEEAADIMIRKDIKLLGLDSPSPDMSPYPIHKKLLGNGILLVENLTGLEQLYGADTFYFFAVPLKLKAEASLVRAFAVIENSD